MKNLKTLILNHSQVERLVDIKSTIISIESVFKKYAAGRTQMPSKIYLNLEKYSGDFRAMPAFVSGMKACTLKWVNVHTNNKKQGLPSVMAVIILSDPKNGFPLCIMDGTHVTNIRTGAAGGVAAKYLAHKDSKILALVGCGAQAVTQFQAIYEIFKIEEVRVWGHENSYIRNFIKKMKRYPLKFKATKDVESCVKNADIIITTTPCRKPLVKYQWLKKGAHINAIGADAKGKQELDTRILKNAKIVIDDWSQASHSGEINIALKQKIITKRNIYSELGDIVNRKKKGRVSQSEITVFDSTGLAIQDVAVANLIYETAKKKKIGKNIRIVL